MLQARERADPTSPRAQVKREKSYTMQDDEIPFGVPRRRQNRFIGWSLRLIGLVLLPLSTIMFFGASRNLGQAVFPNPFLHNDPGESFLIALALFAASILGYNFSRMLRRHGRRHSVPVLRTLKSAKEEPYVLYLRPFASDAVGAMMEQGRVVFGRASTMTVEERLADAFKLFGRLIAVGQPDDRLPQPGAARLYLPMYGWQQIVSSLVKDARLILLTTGTSEGTLWELRQVVRTRKPHNVVLVVLTDEAEYGEFQKRANQIFAEEVAPPESPDRAPVFPDYPKLWNPFANRKLPLPRGFIRFNEDWSPQFVRLDPTAVQSRRSKRAVREMYKFQLGGLFEKVLAARVAEDQQVLRLDTSQRATLRQIEAFIDDLAGDEQDRNFLLRFELTSLRGLKTPTRIRSRSDTSEPADTPASITISSGGNATWRSTDVSFLTDGGTLTVDMPASTVFETIQNARSRGAADSDTFSLSINVWGSVKLTADPSNVKFHLAHRSD